MQNQNTLLQEIHMTPSQEVLTQRFAQNEEIAGCSGKCKSGTCMPAIDLNDNLETYAD